MTAVAEKVETSTATKKPKTGGLGGIFTTGFTWFVGLLLFFPIFWMVLNSFKTEAEANGDPVLLFEPTLENFGEVTETIPGIPSFWEAVTASVVIVLGSTLVVMLLAIPAAYALSIARVPKWRDILFFFISTKFLPVVAAILPLFIIFEELDLTNGPLGLGILYTALNLPLAVWMLRSFFADVPKELIEASRIDGASLFTQLRSVILPVIAPGVAATALLCFIFAWNEFFLAVQLNITDWQTLPVWVTSEIDTRGQFIAKLSAASTLATLPVILAGWVAQKRMIRGLALGAIK